MTIITARTVVIGGVWANEAADPPEVPIQGVSYADSALTPEEIEAGWPFALVVNSAAFNEVMRRLTSLISLCEQYGVLPWSALTSYKQGAITLGPDGQSYRALADNTDDEPSTNPLSWEKYGQEFASGTKMIFYQASAPTGWTQITTVNDRALRIVSGKGGGYGGLHYLSSPPSTSHYHSGPSHYHVFAHKHELPFGCTTGEAGGTGLVLMSPSGVEPFGSGGSFTRDRINYYGDPNQSGIDYYTLTNNPYGSSNTALSGTANTGPNGPTAFAPKYIDVIAATKE